MFRETDPGVSPLLSLGVRIRESASLRDAPFGLLEEDHEHAQGQAYHDGEGGELAAVDEVALGHDFAEHHIEHGAGGEPKRHGEAQRADVAEPEAEPRAEHRGQTARGREKRGAHASGAAGDKRHGHGHALGNVVQADEHGHDHAGAPHKIAGYGETRADGHALGDVVQRDGAGHDHAGDEQRQLGVVVALVHVQVVGVHELVDVVMGFGVVGIGGVRHLLACLAVDEVVQQIHHGNAQRHGEDYQQDPVLGDLAGGFLGLGQKIEAHHGGHDAAGEGQKQADSAVRLALEQRANEAAEPRSPGAGDERDQRDECERRQSFHNGQASLDPGISQSIPYCAPSPAPLRAQPPACKPTETIPLATAQAGMDYASFSSAF